MPAQPPNRTTRARRSPRAGNLAPVAIGVALALAGSVPALAGADAGSAPDMVEADAGGARVALLSRDSQLERSLDVGVTRQRYDEVYAEAKRLDVAPERNLADGVARDPELEAKLASLRDQVARAKARAKAERAKEMAEPEVGSPESVGVSQATLESIAACESGGDPTAVDPSGTYRGKYQFDLGTWASVGGSGDPAAAPEAEQDYRAALLFSQSGSSPWPVCG